MTLLVSSHILAELDEYSTHMLVLREGRILENREVKMAHRPELHRRLHLDLAQPDAVLPEWLQSYAHITVKVATEEHAEFDFKGDLIAQAVLLKALIHEGFIVSSLAEHKENMQQSYLRSVAAHLEGQQ